MVVHVKRAIMKPNPMIMELPNVKISTNVISIMVGVHRTLSALIPKVRTKLYNMLRQYISLRIVQLHHRME